MANGPAWPQTSQTRAAEAWLGWLHLLYACAVSTSRQFPSSPPWVATVCVAIHYESTQTVSPGGVSVTVQSWVTECHMDHAQLQQESTQPAMGTAASDGHSSLCRKGDPGFPCRKDRRAPPRSVDFYEGLNVWGVTRADPQPLSAKASFPGLPAMASASPARGCRPRSKGVLWFTWWQAPCWQRLVSSWTASLGAPRWLCRKFWAQHLPLQG